MTRLWWISVTVYLTLVAIAAALPVVTGDPFTALVGLALTFPSSVVMVKLQMSLMPKATGIVTGTLVFGISAVLNVLTAYAITRWIRRHA